MTTSFESLQKQAAQIKKKITHDKKTPKTGWSRAGSFPPFLIMDDTVHEYTGDHGENICTISELTSVLKVPEIPQEILQRIESAVHQYHIDCKVYLASPKESEVEASLLRLLNGFDKGLIEVRSRFLNIDAVTKDRLAMIDFPDNLDIMNAENVDPDQLLALIENVVNGLSKNKNRRKKSEMPRNTMIYELCDIYYHITGRQPGVSYDSRSKTYGGLFFSFVCTLLSKTPAEIPIYIGRRISEIVSRYNLSEK